MEQTASATETLVNLTDSAANQLRELGKQSDNSGKFLRVYVEGGGCSGMQYGMVFDEKRDDDFASSSNGVTVLVDPVSADYIRGAQIDYVDALTGAGFKISNPNARTSCGCGKSFEA